MATPEISTPRRGQARTRVIEAALRLFTRHGISATSLQMIADEIGVTKAAVYFQFRTKEEIVTAVIEPAMDQLEAIINTARATSPRSAQLDLLVGALVDLVVDNREMTAMLERDPALAGAVKNQERWWQITHELGTLLRGDAPTPEAKVGVTLIAGGLMMTGADPQLSEFDDEQLRQTLKSAMRKLIAFYE